MSTLKRGSNPLCFGCGSSHHKDEYCHAKGKKCFSCQASNHLNTECHHFQLEKKANTTTVNTNLVEYLKAAVNKLKEITWCAVCLETGSVDKIQCVKGHLLCAGCKGRMKQCPTCQQPFSDEKPSIIIRQMIEVLTIKCRHKNCYNILGDKDEHEIYCGFKETDCKFEDCDWTGPALSLIKHVTEAHPTKDIFGCNNKMGWAACEVDESEEYSGIPTLYYFDKHFIWECSFNYGELQMGFFLVPSGKPKSDIIVEITFKSSSRELNFKIKLDLEKDNNDLALPSSLIEQFLNDKGELVYTINFSYSEK